MRVDILTIRHALDKCLEDCLWQDGMECVDINKDSEQVFINNKERIQEIELAINAIKAIEKELG